MQILKGTGIVWYERTSINKFGVDQSVKVWLEQREISVKIGQGVWLRMLFVTNSIHLVEQLPHQGRCQRVGDFKEEDK
jgi:hypothetical protein